MGWIETLENAYGDRILPVDSPVAAIWAELNAPDPLPVIDALIAATGLFHGLTVVTRNTRDLLRTRVPVHNPFSGESGEAADAVTRQG
ncbi:MAG: PIN domain-containing protein [Candidatus Nanopelagicales bacterium]